MHQKLFLRLFVLIGLIFWMKSSFADEWVSSFTDRKIDGSQLTRFKGKSAEDIVDSLKKDGIQVIFINRELDKVEPDPRNDGFTEAELMEFHKYIKFATGQINSELSTTKTLHLAGAMLTPYSLHNEDDSKTGRPRRLPRMDKPTILMIANPGVWPRRGDVLHEYTHLICWNALGKPLLDRKKKKDPGGS
jgi:hypothetical protein